MYILFFTVIPGVLAFLFHSYYIYIYIDMYTYMYMYMYLLLFLLFFGGFVLLFCVCMCVAVLLYECLIYKYLILPFYVNTICLTPYSRFIFVLGCR